MQFHHIIIPTSVIPAINSLPKLSPLDSTARWLAVAVTQIALNRGTMMIDRVMAEDLSKIFEVSVDKIPSDVTQIVDFIFCYIEDHADEGVPFLTLRLQVVAGKLCDMMEKMASGLDR